MRKGVNRALVVGAGLSGLSAALHLAAAGCEVTVLERTSTPGGRITELELGGYRFDTGPLETGIGPETLAGPLAAVGEKVEDWIDFVKLDVICRAHYPDGTTLDVFSDHDRTARGIAQLCGGREATAYLRYRKWGQSRVPAGLFFSNPRTRRLFDLKWLFGTAVVNGAWAPRGGSQAVPRALMSVAEKHGVTFRFGSSVTRLESSAGRVTAAHTDCGERYPTDAVIMPSRARLPRQLGPSHLVIHLGSRSSYQRAAAANIHFGENWQRSKHELLVRGELMRDPTILVLNPSQADPTSAPSGRQTYSIVVPVPNLRRAPVSWNNAVARRHAGEITALLESRGYLDLGGELELSYVVTPDDWARLGMAHGIPHSVTNRPGRLHPVLENVVITGSGMESGRQAAQRSVGARA